MRPPARVRPRHVRRLERLRILTTYQDDRDGRSLGRSDAAEPFRGDLYAVRRDTTIIPVNPRYAGKTILGQPVYASLAEIPRPVDIVDVFRRPRRRRHRRGGDRDRRKVLWLQLGVINDEAAAPARARRAGVRPRPVRQDRARALFRRPATWLA